MTEYCALSSGRREIGGGLERYIYERSLAGLVCMAERARGCEPLMKQLLASDYMFSPRPDGREILSYSVREIGNRMVEVTLIIQRGHYKLLEVLNGVRGSEITISPDGAVRVEGRLIAWVIPASLPDYGKEFQDAESASAVHGDSLSTEIAPDGS